MPHAPQDGVDHDPHPVCRNYFAVCVPAAFVVARVPPAVAVAVFVVVRLRVTTGLALLASSSGTSATAAAFLRVVVFAVLVFVVLLFARVVFLAALAFVRAPVRLLAPVVAFLRVVVVRFLLDVPGNAP